MQRTDTVLRALRALNKWENNFPITMQRNLPGTWFLIAERGVANSLLCRGDSYIHSHSSSLFYALPFSDAGLGVNSQQEYRGRAI